MKQTYSSVEMAIRELLSKHCFHIVRFAALELPLANFDCLVEMFDGTLHRANSVHLLTTSFHSSLHILSAKRVFSELLQVIAIAFSSSILRNDFGASLAMWWAHLKLPEKNDELDMRTILYSLANKV
jgi:hypothetical protein